MKCMCHTYVCLPLLRDYLPECFVKTKIQTKKQNQYIHVKDYLVLSVTIGDVFLVLPDMMLVRGRR